MRAYILTLALVATPSLADSIYREGSDWVRLTARPCANEKVLALIPDPGRRLDFRAATARIGGQDFSGCWVPLTGGVGVIYEDGDHGVIPERLLKPAPEA